MMKKGNFKWCGYEWMPRQKWGTMHPDHPNKWYGEESVRIDDAGNLALSVVYEPRNIDEKNNHFVKPAPCDLKKPHSDFRCGLVRTVESFSYGDFIIKCNLPKGKKLWPSFWFGSDEAWPPEIDVFEGYSGPDSDYKIEYDNRKCNIGAWWSNMVRRKLYIRVEPNIHYYSAKNSHLMVGPEQPSIGYYNFDGENEFRLEWRKNHISIYHNGHRVMHETRKKVLDCFNGKTIHPIINLVVTDDYQLKDIISTYPLVISEFKYIQA